MQQTKNKQTNKPNKTKQKKQNKRPEKTKYKWSPIPFSNPGPNHWPGVCGSGSKQSPINIDTSKTKYDEGLSAQWNLNNYDNNPGGNFTGSNNGHTLKVSFDANYYKVSGGGLTGTYTTVQFHLHWGSMSTSGSEHTLDGHQFPAEVCIYCRGTVYTIRVLYVL